MKQEKLTCHKCKVELTEINTGFNYMNHNFSKEVLRCPVCGKIYLSEEIVESEMLEVEMLLEEK